MPSIRSLSEDAAKRLLDVVAAGGAVAMLSIPLAAVAVAIKLDSPGPVFYRGLRVGRSGRPFRLFKFRSMVTGNVGPSSTSAHDPRITRVGRVIRRYKVDELPQLINVVLGDMSLVGPRPQVQWAVDAFSAEERAILEVRPGVTDWASMRFHNEEEIIASSGIADPDDAYMKLIHPEKTRLQLEYVRRRSFFVDIQILTDTLLTLLRTRTASPAPHEG